MDWRSNMATKSNAKKVSAVKAVKMDKDVCGCGDCKSCGCGHHHWHRHGGCGAIYGLGFIGAMIYYMGTATGFWNGVLGVLKSIVWPVFLVFGLLKLIGM
jgi:hypothetical protein